MREVATEMTPTVKKVSSKKESIKSGSAKKNPSITKPVAKKLVAKRAVNNVATKPAQTVKKAVAAKSAKSDTAKRIAPAKKVSLTKPEPAKKTTKSVKPSSESKNDRDSHIAKPDMAKKLPVKKALAKPVPAKLQSTTTGDSTTITVTPREVSTGPELVIEERRLVMTPPPRPVKSGKRTHSLKPIKGAPAPLVVNESENPWVASELKAMRSELTKELVRLKSELSEAEGEMEDLISAAGVGAGDDQADAGTKTFEREHEMSLVYNARDMVLQTERAIERIDNKTYGRCEECGNPIGKARLQVFSRATLCMSCKQKEERR